MAADDGQRRRIEQTVIEILKDANLEEATEHKVRTMAAERLGVDLSDMDNKRLVRTVVESFLLSSEETKEVVEEQETRPKVAVNDDGDRRLLCKLSDKRNVAVHDFRGKTYVSIRDYYQKDGKQFPSSRGISLTPEQWSAFRNSFPAVEEAIKKMESRIRSKEVGKQIEADVSNPVTSCASQGFVPVETEQVEADRPNSVTATIHQRLINKEINEVGANGSNTVSAFDPHGFVPVDTKEMATDMSNSVNSLTRGLIPKERMQVEAGMSNSATDFAPRGLIPIETTRLDGKNYNSWVHQMESFLKQLDIAYVLTEPCPNMAFSPEASAQDIAQAKDAAQKWVDDNYICHRNILNSLSDHLFNQCSKRTYSAKELWEELKLLYDEDVGTTRSQVNKYIQFRMVDGTSVLDQVQDLHNIANSIIASGMWIDENFHVSVIVSKLPPSWNEFRVKLMREEFLPVNMLMHRLRIEEESRSTYKKVYPFMKPNGQENIVGPRKREMKRTGMHGEIEKDNRGKVCYICGKKGHISRDCLQRKFEIRETRNEKDNVVVPVDTKDNRVEAIVEAI